MGFVPPRDGPVHPIHKTAKRIAAELVLLPREMRGSAAYPEDYLKRISGCRLWTRLRCAYCNCHKQEDDE